MRKQCDRKGQRQQDVPRLRRRIGRRPHEADAGFPVYSRDDAQVLAVRYVIS